MSGSNDRLPYYYKSPTVITPPGTYFYKEVRRLQSVATQPLSLYPGYPIFHLYKQIRDSGTTIETRVGALEYWKPVETLAHIVYEENDEKFRLPKTISVKNFGRRTGNLLPIVFLAEKFLLLQTNLLMFLDLIKTRTHIPIG